MLKVERERERKKERKKERKREPIVEMETYFSVHGGHFIGNGFDGEDGFLVHRSLVLFGGLLVQPRLDIDKKDFKK